MLDSADSGSLLYTFPHISGYRYLVDGPESRPFFLSNAKSLSTKTALGHLTNRSVTLTVCEETEASSETYPVHVTVKKAPGKVSNVEGWVEENKEVGTTVAFVEPAFKNFSARFPASSKLFVHKSDSFGIAWNEETEKWEVHTSAVLDRESKSLHRFEIADGDVGNKVADVRVQVQDNNDNLPAFNQVS